jgi:hypothetical protein
MEADRRKLAEAETAWPVGGLDSAHSAHAIALNELQDLKEDLQIHVQKRPGFWAELFRLESSKRWSVRDAELEQRLRSAREEERSSAANIESVEALARRMQQLRTGLEKAQKSVSQLERNVELASVKSTDTESSLVAARLGSEDDLTKQRSLHARAVAELEVAGQRCRELRDKVVRAQARSTRLKADLDSVNLSESDLRNFQLAQLDRDSMHKVSPYQTKALFEARRDVFIAALDLHKSFIVAAWRRFVPLMRAFIDLLLGTLPAHRVKGGVMQLWDAFFLVVPVVSSTFAAFPRQFAGVGREALAWLLIDEAGQATPQQAAGAIWRAKRTVIVGDPLQLEPICAVPEEIMAPLLVRCSAERQWMPPTASAQTLADRANRHGMWFGDEAAGDVRLWVGCPLLVHRRCMEPMFTIANRIAYGNKMVYGTVPDSAAYDLGPSRWIHVRADSSEGHWVEAQALKALALVHELTGGELRNRERPRVYVISPFTVVGDKMRELLHRRYGSASNGIAGTVHTFQGKEAEHVIFLLCGDPKKRGVISYFAGAKPNLVNVAVTRARSKLYVIGDLEYWTGRSDVHRIYGRMAQELSAQDAE